MEPSNNRLPKAPTGIDGLDDITGGGFPRARATLICGQTGVGKTLLALEFVARGARIYDEPGVFLTFEENVDEVRANAATLGIDLPGLIAQQRLEIEHVRLERSAKGGAYDLDGLFIRIGAALDKVRGQRLALDSLDTLFLALADPVLVREEMRRLVQWLKNRAVTVVITAETTAGITAGIKAGITTGLTTGITGEGGHTGWSPSGIEEYVTDCVILLENRVVRQTATRMLRIVKYRGSLHGANEYPFVISETGITVLPVTTLALNPAVSEERISSGVLELDAMLGGRGYYRGSSVLVSGTPGSGKSTVAASFALASCERGERCLYILLEEPPDQFVRNMRSVGIDLRGVLESNMLQFMTTRPNLYALETHLIGFQQAITQFAPRAVVFDPLSTLHNIEDMLDLKSLLVRLLNFLKARQITSHFVTLIGFDAGHTLENGLSSMIDTWVELRDVESAGERNRVISVLKSRGMQHSNQMREFILSERGVKLCELVVGKDGALVGSARAAWLGAQASLTLVHQQELAQRAAELERERRLKDARIGVVEAAFMARASALEQFSDMDLMRARHEAQVMQQVLLSRRAGMAPSEPGADGDGDPVS